MTSKPDQQATTKCTALLDKKAVADLLGISIRTIDNFVKEGSFPPGVRLGRYLFWSSLVVMRWQNNLFAEQERWRGGLMPSRPARNAR